MKRLPAVLALSLLIAAAFLPGRAAAQVGAGVATESPRPVVSSVLRGLDVESTYRWRPGDALSSAASTAAQGVSTAASWRREEAETFPSDWQGIGWLRFNVTLDDALHHVPLGVDIQQVGATELYVDGRLLHRWGVVGNSPADDVPDRTGDPRPLFFHPESGQRIGQSRVRHVVAVRYSSRFLDDIRWRGVEPALSVRFEPLRPAVERRLDLVHKLSRHQMFLAAVALAFGLVHLMLFVFRPRIGPNVFFALMALAASVHVYLLFGRFVQKDPLSYHTFQFYQLVSFLALALAALRFVYSLLYRRCPRIFYVFVGVALPLAVWVAVTPFWAETWCYVFMLAANLEIVRVVVLNWWRGHRPLIRGAWLVGVGATPLIVLSIYQLLAGLGVAPALWRFIDFPAPYYGMAFLMFSTSIYLGRDFALTQNRLERELVRVQRLSEEKLAQKQLAQKLAWEKEFERGSGGGD